MTKEQEIYKNMKRKGHIYKSHGKWGISYQKLYNAIANAGYNDYHTINTIIDGMERKGYIRRSRDIGGEDPHKAFTTGRYIILKWVN